MLRSIVPWSRNEILLLAWGSRSMRSVLRPLMASAAARFTAVVVFPTPPFWLAMATIIGIPPRDGIHRSTRSRHASPRTRSRQLSEDKPQSAIPGRDAPIVGRGRKRVNQREGRPADIGIEYFQVLQNQDLRVTSGAAYYRQARREVGRSGTFDVSASCTRMGDRRSPLLNLFPDVPRQDGPLVVHRDHDARDPKAGIQRLPALLNRHEPNPSVPSTAK